jgi:hypothetical protein
MKLIISIAVLLLGTKTYAARFSYDELKAKMLRENEDIKFKTNKVAFKSHGITMARSRLIPSLSTTWAINMGEETDSVSSSDASSSAGSSEIPSAGSTSSVGSASLNQDGWSGDLTVQWAAFSRMNNRINYRNSKLEYEKEKSELNDLIQERQIQLAQLILETNSMLAIKRILGRADMLLERNKKRKKGLSTAIVSEKKNELKKREYETELEYQKRKVETGIQVALDAFKDLIPTFKDSWLQRLPQVRAFYPLPPVEKIKEHFRTNSGKAKQLDITVKTYENSYKQTSWEREWIPNVALQGSWSIKRDFEGKADLEDSWRGSIILTFNLFDGFYTYSRRAQAKLSHLMSLNHRKSELSKNMLLISKDYYEAQTQKAKFDYKKAQSKTKLNKVGQLERISRGGAGLDLERTGLLLEANKLEWEALDAMKKYQQNILTLASKAGEFEKVVLNEKKL